MAARSLGIQPQLLDVRTADDLGPAFEVAIRQRADALIVGLDTLTQANQRLIALTLRQGTVCPRCMPLRSLSEG
jgi:hypothetical protein